ncbi:alpha-N-arabinofuranosidase [Arcticibacter tournemirensis]|uniref:non-reducing end alpha-L-arabinofuranosidase n=1 Tax=Arcticibacter tournemirensis TaxID=699437 RepID=A0A4Q0MHH5_9SPHI|nr:alpha-L-arabinofuranosidase C-terminal domain-containing protein [Arcticibacter tournemirensis]RXF72446.1 alpha-N-arabinofuranosidase [Arcticibacter tournemirensis]
MKKVFIFLIALFTTSITISFAQSSVSLNLNTAGAKETISKHIYGHFSEHLGRCIYDGFWVDENMNIPKQGRIRMDVVNALKKINIPNLRWPGGCFADEYHWRDGIGPREQRPKMVNTNWGGVTEDNSFGTHEFMELCELLNCEPYIAGNVGSGTVEEMAKWVEYFNFDGVSPMANLRKQNGHEKPWKVSFWGVGNESWGCGGNMTAEFYSDLYKRYATYARDYPGSPLKKIASGASDWNTNWTEVMMKNVPASQMWGLSLHYYTIPTGKWSKKGSATQFDEKEYFSTMKNCLAMDEIVKRHSAIMDKYDPDKKVALVVDEWGVWTDVEPGTNPGFLYQQNTMRDALIAGSTLNIFNNHCERVRVASLAQTINVLQALILTEKEKMLLTPTYHVFDLYKAHMDAKLIPTQFTSPDYVSGNEKIPAINASASVDSKGIIHISLVNLDPSKKITVSSALEGIRWSRVEGQIVTSTKFNDYNSFDNPAKVAPAKFNGASKKGNALRAELPPLSVVMLELK